MLLQNGQKEGGWTEADMVINHRHTRTGFANARPDSEWRKRKRRMSVLVCGSEINHGLSRTGFARPLAAPTGFASLRRPDAFGTGASRLCVKNLPHAERKQKPAPQTGRDNTNRVPVPRHGGCKQKHCQPSHHRLTANSISNPSGVHSS